MALKYADYLDRLLCSKGKENPGLLSSEWALLHMLCEKLDSDEHAAFELIAGQLADRRSSGPLIRAMKAMRMIILRSSSMIWLISKSAKRFNSASLH
jgi:hypothetical protein